MAGSAFGSTPAPTPAMVDAHVERVDAGEEGFLHDTVPKYELKPNRRLDGKAHLMEYERWNRDWARGSGDDPKGLAPEYEGYIRDIDKDHGHDPGLIFARDLTQQVEKYHGTGSDLAKQLVMRLADRPDLQRQYLGGDVPKYPPRGTFKPGGEDGVKAWIDQDRVANGIAPRYAKATAQTAQNFAQPVSTRTATDGAPQAEPDYKNLLEYGTNFGLPEDAALAQQPPHEPDQPNPKPSNEFGDRDPPPQPPVTGRNDAPAPARQIAEELPSLDHTGRERPPVKSRERIDPPDSRSLGELSSEDFEAVAEATERNRPRAEAALREAQAEYDRAQADLNRRMKPQHREVFDAMAQGAAIGIPTGVMGGAIIDKIFHLPGKPMTKAGLALEGAMGAAEAGSTKMLKAYYELQEMSKERDAAKQRLDSAEQLRDSYDRRSEEIRRARNERGALRPDQ